MWEEPIADNKEGYLLLSEVTLNIELKIERTQRRTVPSVKRLR